MKRLRKPTKKQKDSYRPNEECMSVSEAKDYFKTVYKKRGFDVTKVTRKDWHFLVSFGLDKEGKGKGPYGLPNLYCNWPDLEK